MAIVDLKLPKYELILPISKVKVEYRPFTVKEEKILLLAQEENTLDAILTAIGQIINNCTFGKQSMETLNKVDAEYLFIQLRNKSMGEGVEIRAICKECKHKTPMTLDLSKIVVTNADRKIEPIKITDDVWVTLRYPTIKESIKLIDQDGVAAIALALDQIIEGETSKNASDYSMEERIEFVESLTTMQMAEFSKFFDNFPELALDIKYTCKCGVENSIHLEGIEHFFE